MPSPITARSYHLPDGDRLVETEWAAAPGLKLDPDGRLVFTDGSSIEPRTFNLLDAAGHTKGHHGHPRASALDDYLYITGIHYVRDNKLYTAMVEVGGKDCVFRARLSMERLVRDELELVAVAPPA
jgi:hypothetical protein